VGSEQFFAFRLLSSVLRPSALCILPFAFIIRPVLIQEEMSPLETQLPVREQLISVIIPVYNEEQGIAEVLNGVFECMDQSHYEYEVLVVDDGSTDRTAEVVRQFPRLRLIQHPTNRGTGAATNTAVRHARGEIIAMTDGDGTYPVQDIPRLLAFMDDYDMVIGARTKETGTLRFLRTPAKWFIRTLASYLTETPIPDLNSGLRVFRKTLATKFMHLLPHGHSWVSTITLAHLADDYLVKFVPIDYYPRKGSSSFHPIGDTYNYLLLVVRTVMYFNPIKVLFPVGVFLFGVGVVRQLVQFYTVNLHVQSSNVLLVLAGLNILMMALLADLVVRRARQ
jgi:polyisoprenyl-phosphate glycosyltransferase